MPSDHKRTKASGAEIANQVGMDNPIGTRDPSLLAGHIHSAQENIRLLFNRLSGIEGRLTNTSEYNDSPMRDDVDRLRRDFAALLRKLSKQEEAAADTEAGDSYGGHFKVSYYSGTAVNVSNGYISFRASTLNATGGVLNIGSGAGYHYVLLKVWYNAAWKYSITDYTGVYPPRISTVSDGGNDYECYQRVLSVLQVGSGGEIQESTVTQIIHDEVVDLIDWTDVDSTEKGYLFQVAKLTANTISISAGAVINGTNVLQVSNDSESISSTDGSYYVSISVYYDLGAWTSEWIIENSYPTQPVDEFRKLLAIVVVNGGEITTVGKIHRGDEIINARVAE
jgi:hypothetical protein